MEQPALAVIMDPIHTIRPEKDTTLRLLLEAQSLGWPLYYLELHSLSLKYGASFGEVRPLTVYDNIHQWFDLGDPVYFPLDYFDVILMRKDPPVTLEYIYATYILEHAEQNGVLVVNKPESLRNANEKLFTTWFPECMPPTMVSSSKEKLLEFISEQKTAILKPLHGMGGQGIFKCSTNDPNLNVIIETLTQEETRFIMAQRYIPDILESGDKRILLINGEPIPFALARMPQEGDFRGNLAAGGIGVGVELNSHDEWICAQIGPILREKGLYFVGIDIIGEYLTEINVTSPTCVRELEAIFEVDIASKIIDGIIQHLED